MELAPSPTLETAPKAAIRKVMHDEKSNAQSGLHPWRDKAAYTSLAVLAFIEVEHRSGKSQKYWSKGCKTSMAHSQKRNAQEVGHEVAS